MDTNTLLIIGAVGVGAFVLTRPRTIVPAPVPVPAQNPYAAPPYWMQAQPAAKTGTDYAGIGTLIAGIGSGLGSVITAGGNAYNGG